MTPFVHRIISYIICEDYGKNDFVEIFKNLTGYRSENNSVGLAK